MNYQTKVTASHDDTFNRVLQGNHIQPGNMIDYLESRLHYIYCSWSDLKHEVEMGLAEKVEPGFYEKLFAELAAEVDMVKSIIEKLKGGVMSTSIATIAAQMTEDLTFSKAETKEERQLENETQPFAVLVHEEGARDFSDMPGQFFPPEESTTTPRFVIKLDGPTHESMKGGV